MLTITKPKPIVFSRSLILKSVAILLLQTTIIPGQQQQPRTSAQGAHFTIQLSASPDRAEAEAKLKEAQANKLDAYLVKSNVPGKGIFYRVRVGNYASRAVAEKAAQQFKANGALNEYIIVGYEAPDTPPAPQPAKVAANPKADTAPAATGTPPAPADGLANRRTHTPQQRAEEPEHDFTIYKQPDFMRNVLLGRLEMVTRPTRATRAGDLQREAISKDNRLAMAVMLYHQIYSGLCMANSQEPYTTIATQFYLVEKQGGWEVDRKPGARYETKVRDRFLSAYASAHDKALGLQMIFSAGALLSGSYAASADDLGRFIQQAGCQSRTLALFEENLQRAFNGKKALQTTRAGAEAAPLFFRGCAAVLPQIKAGINTTNACGCLRNTLSANLYYEDVYALEDDFTRERFLTLAVSKVGLREKVGGCLR